MKVTASVIFTSREDENVGLDNEQLETDPDPGEWGGIIFANDVENALREKSASARSTPKQVKLFTPSKSGMNKHLLAMR